MKNRHICASNSRTSSRFRMLKIFVFLSVLWLPSISAMAGSVPGLELTWPVSSGYTSKPGQDYAQFNDGSANRHHSGIDIPAPIGTNVLAAAAGTARVVTFAANDQKTHCMGNVVIIDHDGLAASLYAHLDTVAVSDGQVVAGQVIGTVGNTLGLLAGGGSCGSIGPHLHFELKDNAVLGTTSDDGVTWGYTPEPVVTGQPIPSDHPDSWGFHDPILNLGLGITNGAVPTVEVTVEGAGVSMRTGSDTSYRGIGLSLQVGTQFDLLRQTSSPTSGCSKGW